MPIHNQNENEGKKVGRKKKQYHLIKMSSSFQYTFSYTHKLVKMLTWESEREKENTIGIAIQVKVKDVHGGARFEAEESVHVQ